MLKLDQTAWPHKDAGPHNVSVLTGLDNIDFISLLFISSDFH